MAVRAALPLSHLTEARRRDLHVRMLADFSEVGPDLCSRDFLALGFEAFRKFGGLTPNRRHVPVASQYRGTICRR